MKVFLEAESKEPQGYQLEQMNQALEFLIKKIPKWYLEKTAYLLCLGQTNHQENSLKSIKKKCLPIIAIFYSKFFVD